MARNELPLPKIPGIHQSYMEIKDKYPIGSEMKVIDDVRFIECPEKKKSQQICDPEIAAAMLAKDQDVANKRNWLIFDDKEVLSFDAYFKDTPRYARKVEYDIRELKIVYFLVDETIQVNEPRKNNSGSPQGCLIKRQRIPLPGCDRNTGPFYRLLDLVVGGSVIFYGKEIRITGVDAFTRDFLVKMGIDVQDNEPIPDDPYFTYRKNTNLDYALTCRPNLMRNLPGYSKIDFVLRFRGYWDDRYEKDGELHFFDVLYHLVDDTMEMSEELIDDNDASGKIRHRKFVNRQKLPKKSPWCKYPGHDQKQEILNIITKKRNQNYFKMDSRPLEGDDEPYYKCTDLYIGAILNVFNRRIVLVKCDEFTKTFYKNVYGLNDFDQIESPKTLREIREDQLNAKRKEIILKNHDEVLRKKLISQEGSGVIFVFLIKMITDDPVNQQRDFLLKYYLDDTKFGVYEFRQTNSGLRGGMFRYRRKLSKKQDQKKLFVFHQLFVGATIFFDEFEFTITDVDDKTLRIMMNYPNEFPHSCLKTANKKVREAVANGFSSLEEFRTKHFQEKAFVEREEFRKIVSFEGAVDAHVGVVLSLMHKRPDPFEPYSDQTFKSVVQDTLRRAMFIHFDGLKNNLRVRKSIPDRGEYVEREECIKAMKSNKVPLHWEIINKLLNRFTDEELGSVDYVNMVDFMDYIKYPTELPSGLARELLFVKPKKVLINVNKFVDALRPEEA